MKTAYRKWIAEKLHNLRTSNNYTQFDVANAISIKISTYTPYEYGHAEPSLLTMQKLCKLYKMTVDEFLTGCPSM